MIHEPKQPSKSRGSRHRRAGRGSVYTCLVIWFIAASIGLGASGPNRDLYLPFMEFFFYLWILSLIVVGVFVLSWILDYPLGTRSDSPIVN